MVGCHPAVLSAGGDRETYFRRVRCSKRLAWDSWSATKSSAASKEIGRLTKHITKALQGNLKSLRYIEPHISSLESKARQALGQPNAGPSAENRPSRGNTDASSAAIEVDVPVGAPPHTAIHLRHLRNELVKRQALPRQYVEIEANRITDTWLNSLEGKAAIRHAAWSSTNPGPAVDLAVEPSSESLAAAEVSLRNNRIASLLADESPFTEIMTHKLLGEYLHEMLDYHNE